jgi:hypothetical protein
MAQSELAEVIEEYHRTIDAIVTGDPEPQKRLWSRGDDVALANPLGPSIVTLTRSRRLSQPNQSFSSSPARGFGVQVSVLPRSSCVPVRVPAAWVLVLADWALVVRRFLGTAS